MCYNFICVGARCLYAALSSIINDMICLCLSEELLNAPFLQSIYRQQAAAVKSCSSVSNQSLFILF